MGTILLSLFLGLLALAASSFPPPSSPVHNVSSEILDTLPQKRWPVWRNPPAEKYEKFFTQAIIYNWKGQGPFNVKSKDEISKWSGILGLWKGLYFIFSSPDSGMPGIFPAYVGITDRNFKIRLEEHVTNGAIEKIMEDDPNAEICAYIINCSIEPARFIEAVLLKNFDFLKNDIDNDGTRSSFDEESIKNPADIKSGRNIFNQALKKAIESTKKFGV